MVKQNHCLNFIDASAHYTTFYYKPRESVLVPLSVLHYSVYAFHYCQVSQLNKCALCGLSTIQTVKPNSIVKSWSFCSSRVPKQFHFQLNCCLKVFLTSQLNVPTHHHSYYHINNSHVLKMTWELLGIYRFVKWIIAKFIPSIKTNTQKA